MLIYKCSVCKRGFSRRTKWHRHLPLRKHQELAKVEIPGWDANVRAKVLIFVHLPADKDEEIINMLSDHGKIIITDFVVSSEAPQRIGIVRFETREELLKALSSFESKDDQFCIEGSWCQVRDGGVITELEYNTWLQSLMESLETKRREKNELISKLPEPSKKSNVNKFERKGGNEQMERDQDQKQKEEELRIAANQAVLQMKTVLPPATENWLQNHLHVGNIEEIKNIYSHVLREVQAERRKTVDVQLWKALDRNIDAECKDHCMAYLTDLQNRMQTFYRQVKKKFDHHDCLTANELDKLCTEEYQKVSQDLESSDPEKHHLLEIGCKTMGKYFHELNAKNIANEKKFAENVMPEVLRNYNDEMTRFTHESVYAPNNLKEIHSNLIGRLVEESRKSFRLPATGKICEDVENRLEQLKARLVQEFQKHLQQNNQNLEKLQQQIRKILEASKKSYVEKVEDVLNRNSDGLELRELSRRHQDIVHEAKVLLKMEIRQKIRQDEPLEAHVNSLEAYIDNYWKVVVEANSKNLHKRKKKDKEKKKPEEERKTEALEQERRKKAEKAVNERRGESKTEPTSFQRNANGGAQLPPLVFQLQSSRIRMGMCIDGNPQVLQNALMEQSTPLVVGLTNGGDLVYGTEAQANIPVEGDMNNSKLSRYWWIADYLITTGSQPWTEDIRLHKGAELHTIAVEFLLGFILKKLKEHVEADMKGLISTAVITVPCWLCSAQRIQVKDGGALAGFEEVYLINEAAAAAFACASSELRSRFSSNYNILILSENSGKIDASVYSCSGSVGKKVTLVGHSGSYCMEEPATTYVKAASDLIRKGFNYPWNFKEGDKSSGDKQRQAVQKIRKVVNQAQDPKYNSSECILVSNEVFVISELEDLRPLLEQVGTQTARTILDINGKNGVLIGASLLSQNPDKIKENVKDKLLFGVMRKCGAMLGAPIIPKLDMLPTTDHWRVTSTLPNSAKEADIFQIGLQGELNVGRLKLLRRLSYDQQVELSLGLSNEAIVDIKSVNICSSKHKSKDPVLRNQYEWITPKLPREDKARLMSLLESLASKQKENNELITKMLEASKKSYSEEMTRVIQKGVYAPNELKVIHSNLVGRLVEEFKKSLKFPRGSTRKICEDVEKKLEELKAMLAQGFLKYQQENNTNLQKEQQQQCEVVDAKQQLLQQCNTLKLQLENGTVFKIKSEVVKGMFFKKIEEAIKFAQHESSTLEQIQGQIESLAKWSSRYVK